jgi:predicted ATPase
MNDAQTLTPELSHPIDRVYTLLHSAKLHLERREGQIAQERAETALALATEHNLNAWMPGAMIGRGEALAEQGELEDGIVQMCHGLAVHRATGTTVVWRPEILVTLAEAYGKAGQVEEGLTVLAEALAIVDKAEKHHYEAELYRLKGELLRKAKGGDRMDELPPEACFLRAIDIARRQQAKSLELRAVMSLSRLWREQGKREEACQMLAEIYGWFTEGFDTGDLREAKALLEEFL